MANTIIQIGLVIMPGVVVWAVLYAGYHVLGRLFTKLLDGNNNNDAWEYYETEDLGGFDNGDIRSDYYLVRGADYARLCVWDDPRG